MEIASTQDIAVRKSIIKSIAPIVDSIGINEREAIDILEVSGCENRRKPAMHGQTALICLKH